MKLWIVLIIYFAVGIVNIFLWLLYLRLHGEDTKIYYLDDSENFAIVSFLYLLTGITLPVVLLLYIYDFIKKYMIDVHLKVSC